MEIEIINNNLDYDDIDYYDLVVCGGTIYHIFYDRLICYNIKFGTVINYNFDFDVCNYSNPITNRLSIHCKTKNTIMIFDDNMVNEFPLKIDNSRLGCNIRQCEIINNILIISKEDEIIFQDLLTGNVRSKAGCFNFSISPEKKYVVVYQICYSFIIPLNEFQQFNFNYNDDNFHPNEYCFFKNDGTWVSLYYSIVERVFFATFYNINKNQSKKISTSLTETLVPKYIIDDNLYFCHKLGVTIISSNYDVTQIKSNNRIIGYSNLYKVFIDKNNELFRIQDNRFVRYKLKYDYWRDVGIPYDICEIIQIMIGFELFPLDVINEIYCQIVKLQKIEI